MAAPPGGSPYVPPKQSGWGQFRDAILPIAFVFIILFGATYLLQATSSPPQVKHQTLDQLPITPAERSQYAKLIAAGDVTLDQVDQAVQTQRPDPHKYSLNVPLLLGILALIGVYLWFVFGVSFRQYREVIAEKFGPATGTEPR